MAIPSITGSDGQSDKKGDINCSSKGSNQHFLWICISTHYVLHNYKVSRNSAKRFQWRCADQLFQQYLSFSSNFEVQKESNSEKKNGIKISCGYAYLHIMSFITTKFQVILLSDFRGVELTRKTVVAFILAKFLSSKMA